MVFQLLRRLRRSARGQGLVEFAMLLPLLALLLVLAVDVGRVFFGLVALQNASRIGADYAASNADAWDGGPDAFDRQSRYQLLVQGDLQSLGCQGNTVPDPNFDIDELYCDFGLLTPLAEDFMGSPATLHARTDFAINSIIRIGLPPPPAPPPPVGCEPTERVVPEMVGETMEDAYALWIGSGFNGSFTPGVSNPNKNRTVLTQTLVPPVPAGDCADLTSPVGVTY
jgi:hypothetical protein